MEGGIFSFLKSDIQIKKNISPLSYEVKLFRTQRGLDLGALWLVEKTSHSLQACQEIDFLARENRRAHAEQEFQKAAGSQKDEVSGDNVGPSWAPGCVL